MSPNLHWQTSSKGVWERDLDECEKFYYLSARKESGCLPVTGCASFIDSTRTTENNRVEAAFRKAWTSLRHRHPTLASHVQYDEYTDRWRRGYSSPGNSDEERRWLKSTFHVLDSVGDELQWFNQHAPTFKDSSVFLVQGQPSFHYTLFLRCPHDVTDGVGILQLVNQLFDCASRAYDQGDKYATPEWGSEGVNLSPCLRVAANVQALSDAQSKRLADIQSKNGALYNHPSLLGLPTSSIPVPSTPGRRERLSFTIPKMATEQILQRAKSISPGVSVTHVFMAALALALSELQPQKENPQFFRYVNHSMINLRPSLNKPYDGPDHAAATYHTISAQALGIDVVVPGSSTSEKSENKENRLSQIATRVRDFYKLIRPDQLSTVATHDQIGFAPLIFKIFTPASGVDPHAVSEPIFSAVSLSSIGNISSIVATKYWPLELENVWVASEPIGAAVALFLGTWDEKIELSAVFDNRYHEADYIESFLRHIVNCVGTV